MPAQNVKAVISIVLISFALWCGHFSAVYAEDEKSVINIEQAQKSEYKKDPVNGGDCIILTGDVKISVSRGGTKTTIGANTVNYNRATEMIYAEGNVQLEQSGGSSGNESITASSLLFNTATLEGVFDDGRAVQTSSDAINLPSGSTLIVASDVFGRDSSGTIAFKTGELTFCDDENPHWRIKATRIWLLPGGEFAFLNAMLYVGNVPLLWLPAFYYPKDELVFNPAFGYRAREGYFINTTTYLYGRKPADAKSTADIKKTGSSDSDDKINFFSFMNTGSMKEQRREGLILHNLNEDFKGDTSSYFKVMADYYANLGAMVGFEGAFRPGEKLTSLETGLKLGFSNTIFRSQELYLNKNALGNVVQDKSNFLGKELQFRYETKLKMNFAKPFSLTFELPVYSDPYFDYDFNTRAETMDWIDFAMSGEGSDSEKNEEEEISEISSFTWNLNGNYTVNVPSFLNPFISSVSISNFGSSIVFSSKANTELTDRSEYKEDSDWAKYTPEQKFFYPSQITPFKVSSRISGTLVKIPSVQKTTASVSSGLTLKVPEELDDSDKSQKEKDSEENTAAELKNKDEKTEEAEKSVLDEKYLPKITTPSFSVVKLSDLSYSLDYSISPDFTSQLSYASENLKKPEDFEWNDMQSTYIQLRAPTTLTSRVGYRDSFISLTDTFSFNPVYQRHPYLKKLNDAKDNGGYTDSSIDSIKKTDYSARKLDVTDTNALTFRPFYLTEHFSDTALTWNTTIKMIETKFIGDAENPQWEYLTMDLDDENCVTVHNLNLVLAASEFNKKVTQQLSLTTTLPPQVDQYRGVLTLGFPFLNFSASTGVKQKSSTDSTWVKEDFSQSATVSFFGGKLKLTENYVYNMEEERKDSLKVALSGYGIQLAKTWSYVSGYDFNSETGWIAKGTDKKEFQEYQLSLAYSSPSKTFKKWKERISFAPSLSTSAVYDYLRPTNSYFKFVPGVTFKINNFLNLTFSAETRNSQIYRYFCSESEYSEKYRSNGERNVIKDLMNSFRFDDESKRKSSGFKIQSFKIDVTHELDDWDFNCSFNIKPRLLTSSSTGYNPDKASRTGGSYYDFSPHFSISVSWRPLASMKTEIVDEYGEWKLNP